MKKADQFLQDVEEATDPKKQLKLLKDSAAAIEKIAKNLFKAGMKGLSSQVAQSAELILDAAADLEQRNN